MPRYSPEATEKRRLKNFDAWVSAARSVHADRFDYEPSRSSFINQKSSLLVHCRLHNATFNVSGFDHLRYRGGGCPECESAHRSTAGKAKGLFSFMSYFESNLKGRLELLSDYQGMGIPIKVRCMAHGEVNMITPDTLVNKKAWGCGQCARESVAAKVRLTLDDIKEKFADVLPSHVTVVGVTHSPNKPAMVTIQCDIHGDKPVLVGYLTRSANGNGYFCPKCGDENVGYAAQRLRRLLDTGEEGRPTWIGVMEVEVYGVRSLKVGVSTRPLTDRYGINLKTIYFSAKLPERDALLIENEIHRSFTEYSDKRILFAGMRIGRRWGGDTECYLFKAQAPIMSLIKQRLNEVERRSFDYRSAANSFVEPDFTKRDVSRPVGVFTKAKPVICLDTGDWFPSASDAALWARTSGGNLSAALAGKRRVAGGYRWVWAEDFAELSGIPELPDKAYRRRKVLRVEDGHLFGSLAEAAKACGISSSHITGVCRGSRRSAGGFTWKYVDDDS